jgi:hypothetical protein
MSKATTEESNKTYEMISKFINQAYNKLFNVVSHIKKHMDSLN